MQLNVKIILLVFAVMALVFLAFIFNIYLTTIQVYMVMLVVAVLIIIGLASFLQQKREFSAFDSSDALQLIKDRWKKDRGEALMLVDSRCMPKNFVIDGSTKRYYGFVLTKRDGESFKEIVAWVQTNPKDVFWDDDPHPMRIDNPFWEFYPSDEYERRFWKSQMQRRSGINIYAGSPHEEDEEIEKLKGKKKEK